MRFIHKVLLLCGITLANVFIYFKQVFHLANLFARTSKKRKWLAGDVVSVCHQPIKLLLSLFARTNSPSGKPALYFQPTPSTFPEGGNWSTRRKPTIFGRAVTDAFHMNGQRENQMWKVFPLTTAPPNDIVNTNMNKRSNLLEFVTYLLYETLVLSGIVTAHLFRSSPMNSCIPSRENTQRKKIIRTKTSDNIRIETNRVFTIVLRPWKIKKEWAFIWMRFFKQIDVNLGPVVRKVDMIAIFSNSLKLFIYWHKPD